MFALTAIISVLACGGEPGRSAATAPVAPPPSPAPAAAETRDGQERRPPEAPALAEADRPVSDEVQHAIDLLNSGDAAGARRQLDAWVEDRPDDIDARYWRAKAALQTMAWSAAEADARVVITAAPDWVNPRVVLGGALAMQKRCEDALPHLERVIELMPGHHIGYVNRGSCRYRVGDVEGSIADAQMACELGNDRACRMVPKLEKRKAWKENLAHRKAGRVAGTEAESADEAAPATLKDGAP